MSKKSILVVEDDFPTTVMWQHTLIPEYDVHFAESMNESLDVLRQHQVDLVLLDLSLKGDRDGIDLLKYIKSEKDLADIPIFAVTAHAFEYDRITAVEAGCDEYFTKPVNLRSMVDRIHRLFFPDEA